MKSETEIRVAMRRLELDLPQLVAKLDVQRLGATLHQSYELLMVDTPELMQDEVHNDLRSLMVRAGIVGPRKKGAAIISNSSLLASAC